LELGACEADLVVEAALLICTFDGFFATVLAGLVADKPGAGVVGFAIGWFSLFADDTSSTTLCFPFVSAVSATISFFSGSFTFGALPRPFVGGGGDPLLFTLPSRSSELKLFILGGGRRLSVFPSTRLSPRTGLDGVPPSTAMKLARTFDRLSEPAGDLSRGGGEATFCWLFSNLARRLLTP
jgi:hypothetical protein